MATQNRGMAHCDRVAISRRKRLDWSHAKRMAVIFTINCEYWNLPKDAS